MKPHRSTDHCHSVQGETAVDRLSCDRKSQDSRRLDDRDDMAVAAMHDASVKVVAENRRRKLPLALWRNGKVVIVPASKVRLPKQKRTGYARI